MGLDMYLNAERYLWSYPEDNPDNAVAKLIAAALGSTDLKVKKAEIEACYWRKANHIHSWFITNCADGVDDCQSIDVPVRNSKSYSLSVRKSWQITLKRKTFFRRSLASSSVEPNTTSGISMT